MQPDALPPYNPSVERRSGERRSGVADDWRAAQPNAWRLESFKMQIAQEARLRREARALHLAVVIGTAIGVAGGIASLFG